MIDPAIQVRPGTDVTGAWDRFEVFEALHHSIKICNPMTSAELDEVIDACAISRRRVVLDTGCGSGETLIRCVEWAESNGTQIRGTGIDLSPWMITAAHRRAEARVPNSQLQWVLGEARDFALPHKADVAVCIGAEWIWHDFNGTARALAERTRDGGVVAIGAARLHRQADPAVVSAERGHVDTIDEMRRMLARHGLEPLHRVDPDDAGWDNYLAATAAAARQWAELHPGPRAEQWLEDQVEWQAARDRDRDIIGWSVWIAQKLKPIT